VLWAQVATAATMSAAGLEAMRMALFFLEQRAEASTGPYIDDAALHLAGMESLAVLPAVIAGLATTRLFISCPSGQHNVQMILLNRNLTL